MRPSKKQRKNNKSPRGVFHTTELFLRSNKNEVHRLQIAGPLLQLDLLHEINRSTYGPIPMLADQEAQMIALRRQGDPFSVATRCQYEWLGDMVVNEFIAHLLIEMVRKMKGAQNVYLQSLINWAHSHIKSNNIFGMIAFKLGLYHNPRDKTAADIFEAYIYVFSVDRNKHLLDAWVRSIFEPIVSYAVFYHILNLRTIADFEAERHPMPPPGVKQEQSQHQRDDATVMNEFGFHQDEDGVWVLEDDNTDSDEANVDNSLLEPAQSEEQAQPRVPTALASQPSAPGLEWKRVTAQIKALKQDALVVSLVRYPGLEPVTVPLQRSVGVSIESFKPTSAGPVVAGIEVLWKDEESEGSESPKPMEMSDDEDDDLVYERFGTIWTVKSPISLWIPHRGGHPIATGDVKVAHPWRND